MARIPPDALQPCREWQLFILSNRIGPNLGPLSYSNGNSLSFGHASDGRKGCSFEGDSMRRMARLFAVVFGSVLIVSLVGVTDVTASTISCGSTLGAGDWELDSNLVCAGVDPVIIVTSGARLNLKGNSVDCGGAGVGIFVLGATDVHINNGHVHHCDVGIWLVRGGFHQLNALHVDSNHHAGIFLQLSSDNHLSGSEVSSNAEFGILIEDSSRNQLNTMIIKSNGFVGVNLVSFGPPPRSDDNEISSSDVSSNFFIGEVYVTNNGSGTVSVIGTATHSVIATIPVGSSPSSPTSNDNLKKLYVNNGNNTIRRSCSPTDRAFPSRPTRSSRTRSASTEAP